MKFLKALDGFEWLSWVVQDVSLSQEGQRSKFVLEVAETQKDRDLVSELQWRQTMMQQFRGNGIICQVIVPTTTGQLHSSYKADDGSKEF